MLVFFNFMDGCCGRLERGMKTFFGRFWSFMFFVGVLGLNLILIFLSFYSNSFNNLLYSFHFSDRNFLGRDSRLFLCGLLRFLQVLWIGHFFLVVQFFFLFIFLFVVWFIEIRSGAIFPEGLLILVFGSDSKFLIVVRKLIDANFAIANALNNLFFNLFNIGFFPSFNLNLMRGDYFHFVFI